MKKVLLTKSAKAVACVKIISPDGNNSKSRDAYSELFRALLDIPEKDVQQRVLDAINGTSTTAHIVHAMCPNCKCTFGGRQPPVKTATGVNSTQRDVATQTDNAVAAPNITLSAKDVCAVKPLMVNGNNITSSGPNSNTTSDDSRELNSPATLPPEQELDANSSNTAPEPVRRKRRRKVCLPQVVKRSHAQLAQSQLQPKMKKLKTDTLKHNSKDQASSPTRSTFTEFSRRNSLFSLIDCGLENLLLEEEPKSEDHVYVTMAKELLEASIPRDGLLPLHHAIMDNDPYKLRRQIFVWKNMRQCDLNTILTDEDEDCLQLAVVNDCYTKIIDILLQSGLNANVTDNHSNTCIHLAILNEIELDSLRTLMKSIDLSILLKLNDDGYTPLQLAVRHDHFRHAEVMLNVLDECLLGQVLYARTVDDTTSRAQFGAYYEKACKQLELKFNNATSGVAQPKMKKRLLEAGDMKSGNTALFFAIENKFEHFVYFLLAHLTDPRVENHSGQDAKSYYSEFGKMLGLSLKVDNAMENVIQLIQHHHHNTY